jgi:AcrR family transcriptional regulator
MDDKSKPSVRGELTRDALLEAATLAFAREGFGPANLREIAQAAEVNQALIGYHFHGKEGLYLAVFERLVARIRQDFDPILAGIDQLLQEPEAAPERCLEALLGLVEGVLLHMVHEHPAWCELVLREQQTPGPAYDLLYREVIARHHGAMFDLLRKLRPGEDTGRVRLLAATIASQALAVRHSRVPMMRLLGWDAIGPRELDLLKAMIRRNTTLLALGD